MRRIVIIGGDDNIIKGMNDTFGDVVNRIEGYSSDDFHPEILVNSHNHTLVIAIAEHQIGKTVEAFQTLRKAYPNLFLLAVDPQKQANQALFESGADIVLNDKHYWLPLLAQIRAIMRRISYNRILSKQKPTHTEFDVLDLNPFSYPYGGHLFKEYTVFKFFHPEAELVELELYQEYEKEHPTIVSMLPNGQGDWGLILEENLDGWFYGYRAVKDGKKDHYLIADPYAEYLTTANNHLQYPKAKLVHHVFDWEGDSYLPLLDARDLVIYETHIKDLVVHKKQPQESWYQAFENHALPYLKSLGVNTIEFLPLQKFAYYEPPYQSDLNSWNPFEVNYWGYMTTGFFAPETIYSHDGNTVFGEISGKNGDAIHELKQLIKACHKQGFRVIMDVVYNHISNYDLNPLRLVSEEYYLRKNHDGSLRSDSGCGNDFRSENPKARQLIVDSILHWLREYHIDGFRFDLAQLIDKETFTLIQKEAKLINPNVILIAEPWGGGYDPAGFSNMGMQAWNDRFRNGVKGSSPDYHRGYIFGEWHHGNDRFALENYLKGTLQGQSNGLFKKSAHSVNYLESHDGYTLGDFIRYASGNLPMGRRLKPEQFEKLSEKQERIARIAAVYLFVSQGIPMIHAGQEFARAKWNPPTDDIDDLHEGQLSHDSYNRDNDTNYIQWRQLEANKGLWNYYKGLIKLRNAHPALRYSKPENFTFYPVGNDLILMVQISGFHSGDDYDLLLIINSSKDEQLIDLPDFDWEEILNLKRVSLDGNGFIRGQLLVEAQSAYLFRKMRE